MPRKNSLCPSEDSRCSLANSSENAACSHTVPCDPIKSPVPPVPAEYSDADDPDEIIFDGVTASTPLPPTNNDNDTNNDNNMVTAKNDVAKRIGKELKIFFLISWIRNTIL
ncbi:unnamed protein product [Gongylonema pulchrum]|uniref:Uncharacterized protein n=1 Tax=Gongylonema pulchrum TaxID=637853 RepID=A0A183F0E2_9BILA|nr:unnamed protein product [Gongylonema pulchrum]